MLSHIGRKESCLFSHKMQLNLFAGTQRYENNEFCKKSGRQKFAQLILVCAQLRGKRVKSFC